MGLMRTGAVMAAGAMVGRAVALGDRGIEVAAGERTGGRGPDVCIEAGGMEAHGFGPLQVYDQVKQRLRLESDRPAAVREAIRACPRGRHDVTHKDCCVRAVFDPSRSAR
jgi:phage-related baseplate assembly protein